MVFDYLRNSISVKFVSHKTHIHHPKIICIQIDDIGAG